MMFYVNSMRFILNVIFVCILLSSRRIQVECIDQAVGEQIYEPKEVKEYQNFGSVSLFRFQVPDQVTVARWFVNKAAFDADNCPDLPVKVVIEKGSLPIINPQNSSFPNNTRVPKNGAKSFTIPTGKTSLILTATKAMPGDWFIITYREKLNNKIKQKGLSTTCHYFAYVMLIYDRLTFVESLSSTAKNSFIMEEQTESVLYKFLVESNIASVVFTIADCVAWSRNKSLGDHCPISMQIQPLRLPDGNSESTICLRNVSTDVNCSLEVDLPFRETWYYVSVTKLSGNVSTVVDVNITVSVTVCENPVLVYESLPYGNMAEAVIEPTDTLDAEYPNTTTVPLSTSLLSSTVNFTVLRDAAAGLTDLRDDQMVADILNIAPTPVPLTSPSISPSRQDNLHLCFGIIHLSTNLKTGLISKDFFSTSSNRTVLVYSTKNQVPFIASFKLGIEDVGGVVVLRTGVFDEAPQGQLITSVLCLKKDAPPVWNGTGAVCDDDNTFTGDVTNGDVDFFFPFPDVGMWYVMLYATCSQRNSSGGSVISVPCNVNTSLFVNIEMDACINGCGENGRCEHYNEDGVQVYACRCLNNYMGWGCTDDRHVSSSNFLITVLLLTLSNLIFLVDAFLALYRRHLPEAISFACTCFFSTFYHACDSGSYCLMDYDTLQFCDFFASFMSIWLILIAMARLPYSLKSLLHILGAYGLALGAQYDRFSIWSVAVPLGAGIGVLLISWGVKMKKRRKLYPSLKRWLFFIVPGTLLAVAGLIFNATLETDSNYQYVHSIWHMCMGLGVLFLMPPREKPGKNDYQPMAELVDINALNSELIANDDPGY